MIDSKVQDILNSNGFGELHEVASRVSVADLFSSASRPMTEECPISAYTQAGKGPRTARGAVPTSMQLCRDAVPTLPSAADPRGGSG
jgi:hypothetical protein